MSTARTLTLRNRQRVRVVNLALMRRIGRALLEEHLEETEYDLGVYLVAAREMTHLNETFLQHEGSTDVITFDYAERGGKGTLHGEIFVCVDEAILQARRFRTSWQSEVVRYFVHGTLHLLGYDDHRAAARRKMKREENRLVRKLSRRFEIQGRF
jgi:probable rRNA maturation factor